MQGDATTLLTSQLAAAAACSYLLKVMQRAKYLPWITTHTAAINAAFRAGLSLAATLGISHAWTAAEGGGGTLAITIPPLTVLVHGAWHWFGQYAITHGWGKLLDIGDPAPAVGKENPAGAV